MARKCVGRKRVVLQKVEDQAYRSSKKLELNKRVTELEGLIAEAERQSREIDQMLRQMFAQKQFWWEKDYREFSYEECEAFDGMLIRLKDYVMQFCQVNNEDASASNQRNQAEAPFPRANAETPLSGANGVPMDTRALLPDQFNGSIVPFESVPSGADQSGHVVPP